MQSTSLLIVLGLLLAAASCTAQSVADGADPVVATDSTHPVCGTALWMWSRSHAGRKHAPQIQRLLQQLPSNRPSIQNVQTLLTAGGHFRVHYTLTGSDAVSPVDLNGNSVPDYIDSMSYYLEMAWTVEIDEYGYPKPPADNGRPGEGGEGPEVDVYVQSLPPTTYGGAYPEDNSVGDGRVSGYLWLDNDYKGYPTSGIPGLRVTTAHEFQHIIQFSSYYYDYTQACIYEATAVWFEQQVHPSIPDYHQYVNAFLQTPQFYGFGTNNVGDGVTGYAHETYVEFLAKRCGRDAVRTWWERFAANQLSFDALDQVLRDYGMTLSSSWCQFARWCYYTGKRAGRQQDTSAALKDAGLLRTMSSTLTSNPLDQGDAQFNDGLYPLSFGIYRVLLPTPNPNLRDSLDFLVTNARGNLGGGGQINGREAFSLSVSASPHADYVPLLRSDSTTIYYRIMSPNSDFCIESLSDGAPITSWAHHLFPQPFVNNGISRLIFALETSWRSKPITKLELRIYSRDMTLVNDVIQTELQTENNLSGAAWDGKDQWGHIAPSGIYIYTLSVNNQIPTVGKFAVVRN